MTDNLTEIICDVRTRGIGNARQRAHNLPEQLPALLVLFLLRSKG